ncbi:hypothetical protein OG470_33095 [Micromonospora sp. NBC_00389]|uniref:hypothetical protein n=1 Tax=Micromonospora sp. NBC_00389 TaxID=2903586 RepID=UPI002E1FA748
MAVFAGTTPSIVTPTPLVVRWNRDQYADGDRQGTFVYYSAAGEHVRRLLRQALFHADHIDRNLSDAPPSGR